jgi:hypothetical protein
MILCKLLDICFIGFSSFETSPWICCWRQEAKNARASSTSCEYSGGYNWSENLSYLKAYTDSRPQVKGAKSALGTAIILPIRHQRMLGTN